MKDEAGLVDYNPAEWLRLPFGGMIFRADIKACGDCGRGPMAYIEASRDGKVVASAVRCPRCLPPDSRKGERIVAHVSPSGGGTLIPIEPSRRSEVMA